MNKTLDTSTSTLPDQDREILAFCNKQERQQKMQAQQIEPRQSTGKPQLSFARQRFWVVQQMADAGAACNLTMGLQVPGPLRIDLVEKCLAEIIRRLEMRRNAAGIEHSGRKPALEVFEAKPEARDGNPGMRVA